MEQRILAPTSDDIERLARHAIRVGDLSRKHLGRDLDGTDGDLDIIQELLVAGVIGERDTHDLECLGTVLGVRVCHAIDKVDWAIVEDEHGRDSALRYADTDLLMFPSDAIARRIEEGSPVNVRELFVDMCARVEALKRHAGQTQRLE